MQCYHFNEAMICGRTQIAASRLVEQKTQESSASRDAYGDHRRHKELEEKQKHVGRVALGTTVCQVREQLLNIAEQYENLAASLEPKKPQGF
jgi:hypothetical protein